MAETEMSQWNSDILQIRPLSEADLDPIYEIERTVYDDPWTRDLLGQSLSAPLTYVSGLFDKNELIGYAIYQIVYTEGHLLNIAISRSHQKKGKGNWFLDVIMREAERKGALNFFLEVRPSNMSAIHLYEKKGFRRLTIRERYYSNGESAIVMVADLGETSQSK